MFLEGWGYSQRAREEGFANVVSGENPFSGRLAVNESAFADADPEALSVLAGEFGVDYLVVDRFNGIESDLSGLKSEGEVVFNDSAVVVLRISEDPLKPSSDAP